MFLPGECSFLEEVVVFFRVLVLVGVVSGF